MQAFFENTRALFFALAFGSVVFGLLARLLGCGAPGPSSCWLPFGWSLAYSFG